MRKMAKIVLSVTIMFVLLVSVQAFSASGNSTISLGKNKTWTPIKKATARTGNYNDVKLRNNSCYPGAGGHDNYKIIWGNARLTTGTGTILTKDVELNEEKGTQTGSIKNGYLGAKSVIFVFRGNQDHLTCKADVTYNAR